MCIGLRNWRDGETFSKSRKEALIFHYKHSEVVPALKELRQWCWPKRQRSPNLSRASADCMPGAASVQVANRFPHSNSLGESLHRKIGSLKALCSGWVAHCSFPWVDTLLSGKISESKLFSAESISVGGEAVWPLWYFTGGPRYFIEEECDFTHSPIC